MPYVRALEGASADTRYDRFHKLHYQDRLDTNWEMPEIKYAPDTAAFAALKARRAELDNEFYGKEVIPAGR